MARSASSRPGRSLGALVGIVAVIYGVIAAGVVWSTAEWTPKLAIDLAGGTELVMTAVPQPGTSGTITQQTLDEAVKIIRQRINGSGVSEAEITTQGDKNIVVTLPGKTDKATKDSVEQAAALEFRPVLVEQGTAPAASPSSSPTGSATPGASPSGSPSASSSATATLKAPASGSGSAAASPSGSVSSAPTASSSGNGMAVPKALLAPTPTPTAGASGSGSAAAPTGSSAPAASGSPSGSVSGSPAASGSPSPAAKPTDASDMNWLNTPGIAEKFQSLDCTKAESRRGISSSDPSKPLVTCSPSGDAKYVLGPAEVQGKDISDASASLETNSQGQVGTAWQVNMEFNSDGAAKFAAVTKRLATLTGSQNQFAIVLDGLVISAPRTNEAITAGNARITGGFTQETSQSLANQLKFGALPIAFQELNSQEISATLGSEQLQRGLLAGLIGLLLVVLYSLAQYRALGLVTVFSLVIAAVITYGFVALLGWRQGYRLSLPGVAGLIVSIGITADSFIVYFERVRDEVRDGRGLVPAVESAWVRARRTILISDGVSFLAAVVLYALAIGGVRGFAFTLGLTTLVDVLVVFLFTHPMVALLARTRFFGGGHKLSGFDAEHLGRAVAYTGRGTSRAPRAARSKVAAAARRPADTADATALEAEGTAARSGTTIAERRAAEARAKQDALLAEPGAGGTDGEGTGESGAPDVAGRTLQPEAAGDARRRDA